MPVPCGSWCILKLRCGSRRHERPRRGRLMEIRPAAFWRSQLLADGRWEAMANAVENSVSGVRAIKASGAQAHGELGDTGISPENVRLVGGLACCCLLGEPLVNLSLAPTGRVAGRFEWHGEF